MRRAVQDGTGSRRTASSSPPRPTVIIAPVSREPSARRGISRSRGTPPERTWSATTSAKASTDSKCSASAALSRSEEHTSELQSRFDLVCRLLLEKTNPHKQHCKHELRNTPPRLYSL